MSYELWTDYKISQKIIDYAIWYYLRYYPSRKKLSQKLEEKFWVNSENWKKYGWIWKEEIRFILKEKLRNIIQEKEVLRSKIKNYKMKWKNISYIKANLLKKWFILDEVSEILKAEFDSENRSFLEEDVIRKKIENYKNKWKSKNYIRQKFIERSLDKEIIENILDEVFETWEFEILEKEYEKIKNKFEKQKIIEKLLRKWFLYDDIKKLIIN